MSSEVLVHGFNPVSNRSSFYQRTPEGVLQPAALGTLAAQTNDFWPRFASLPKTLAVAGDSILSAGFIFTSVAAAYCARSPLTWALAKLGYPVNITRVSALGGQTTAQLLTQYENSIAPARPGYCFFNGFINDPGAGITVDQSIANLKQFARLCFQQGTLPIYLGVHAVDSANLNYKSNANLVNQSMRSFMAEAGGEFCDSYSRTLDVSTGNSRANYLYDGTHFTALGAQVVGELELYPILLRLLGDGYQLASSLDGNNLFNNALLQGSNATGTNGTTITGFSGTPQGPDGLTADVTNATGSTVTNPAARSDGKAGNVFQLNITPSAANGSARVYNAVRWGVAWSSGTYTRASWRVPTVDNGFMYNVLVGGTTAGAEPSWPVTEGSTVVDGGVTWKAYRKPQVGETWQAEFEFIACTLSSGGGMPTPIVSVQDGAGSTLFTAYAHYFEGGSEPYNTFLSTSYRMKTPPFVLPASTLWMTPQFRGQGSNGGSFSIGATLLRLYKVLEA